MGLYQIVNQKSQNLKCKAEVVKLVDTHVSEACGASCAGSSPAFGTFLRWASPPSVLSFGGQDSFRHEKIQHSRFKIGSVSNFEF